MKQTADSLRLVNIRAGLRRGDKKEIAKRAQVTPVWVSYVIGGRGTSEHVLQIAESYIRERNGLKND